jgi:hypothetical protein
MEKLKNFANAFVKRKQCRIANKEQIQKPNLYLCDGTGKHPSLSIGKKGNKTKISLN